MKLMLLAFALTVIATSSPWHLAVAQTALSGSAPQSQAANPSIESLTQAARKKSASLSPAAREANRKLLANAFTLFQQGDFESAKRGFEMGLGQDPADGAAHFYLAETLTRLKEPAQAREHYQMAAALSPTSLEGLKAGSILERQARQTAEECIAPGVTLFKQSDSRNAMLIFQECAQRYSTNSLPWLYYLASIEDQVIVLEQRKLHKDADDLAKRLGRWDLYRRLSDLSPPERDAFLRYLEATGYVLISKQGSTFPISREQLERGRVCGDRLDKKYYESVRVVPYEQFSCTLHLAQGKLAECDYCLAHHSQVSEAKTIIKLYEDDKRLRPNSRQ